MLGFAKWKALEGELLEGTYLYLLFQKQSFAKAQDVLPACDYELHCTPVECSATVPTVHVTSKNRNSIQQELSDQRGQHNQAREEWMLLCSNVQ